jgi:hypothetical protein
MTKYINEPTVLRQIPEGLTKPYLNEKDYYRVDGAGVKHFDYADYRKDLDKIHAALASQPTFLKIGSGWERFKEGDTVDGSEVEIRDGWKGDTKIMLAVLKHTAEKRRANSIPLKEIKNLRNQLPDSWRWHKCYELPYINSRTGRELNLKHWALTAPDGKGLVCSLGLISHDHHTENHKKFLENDVPVEWVEKSLLIVDSLLAEIDRLNSKTINP